MDGQTRCGFCLGGLLLIFLSIHSFTCIFHNISSQCPANPQNTLFKMVFRLLAYYNFSILARYRRFKNVQLYEISSCKLYFYTKTVANFYQKVSLVFLVTARKNQSKLDENCTVIHWKEGAWLKHDDSWICPQEFFHLDLSWIFLDVRKRMLGLSKKVAAKFLI